MTRVTITVPPRPYDAVIESGSLGRAGPLLREVLGARERLFVVTVPPVRRKWGRKLVDSLNASGFKVNILEMKDGEPAKTLATVEQLAERMIQLRADRRAAIVAFGGGVVGDVAGLLSSVYMRGVAIVQIPTTVQAQVDAAIGGKTGVNLRSGKNLVGTFHQPRLVLIDPAVLATLPDREFCAGLYESLKAGVIGRPELFERLEKVSREELRRDSAALEWVIAESVRLKAEVVTQDEREGGLRRVLNYGHTIGHALESNSNYRRFLHGEAVAWGMIAANHIAVAAGHLPNIIGERINNAVLKLGPLPSVIAPSRKILGLLQTDKKTSAGVVHFVLPKEIGRIEVVRDVPEKVIMQAVDELRRLSSERKPSSPRI
jgi:3-dehydroquinate synthase